MTIIQAIAIGLLGGTLGTTGVFIWIESKSKQMEIITKNQSETINTLATIQGDISKGQIDIQKNLTAPDLLAVSCSAEYLETKGDLLCREMFCRLQTREGAAASQAECEELSNLANTLKLIQECTASKIEIKTCLDYLDTRK
tara:strand:- start:1299 stop:1724 length:426 start_codon:yes stop_codon:yes gene_type:complete